MNTVAKNLSIILLALSAIVVASCSTGPGMTADTVVLEMNDSNFDNIAKIFSNDMKFKMTPQQLASAWNELEDEAGEFLSIKSSRAERVGDLVTTWVICSFMKKDAEIKIVFNKEGKITEIRMYPPD